MNILQTDGFGGGISTSSMGLATRRSDMADVFDLAVVHPKDGPRHMVGKHKKTYQ